MAQSAPVRFALRPVTLSIGQAARRTGTGIEQLRAWHRRYGLAPSGLTKGGHRRYTELDVARISYAQNLIRSGVNVHSAVARCIAADEATLGADRNLRTQAGSLANIRQHAVSQRLQAAHQQARALELRELTRRRAEAARAAAARDKS